MKTVTPDSLRNLAARIFQACNTDPDDAERVASLLVAASVRGLDSHGIFRIPQYVANIREGTIKPGTEIEIVRETTVTALLDLNWNFGQLGALQATEMAIDKARAHGMGCAVLRRSHHVGCLGLYTEMAARAGMVSMAAASGGSSSGHWVAPWGGREGRIGTNPISCAAPTSAEPVLFDVATSAMSEGKVRLARDTGAQLPPDCLVDGDGKRSTNPADLYDLPAGAILPVGGDFGYKGYGFSMMAQALSTLLSGATAERMVEESNNLWIMAIDIEAFMPADEFRRDMDAFIEYQKSSAPAQGHSEVIMPGDRDFAEQRRRETDGIQIPDEVWSQIEELAKELQVSTAG